MLAVGGVQAVAVHVADAAVKQVPAPPVGVTVNVTLSPPESAVTRIGQNISYRANITTGPALIL